MRIAFLPGSFRPDRCGVSHYTARLMAELSARGVECVAVTCTEAAAHHGRPDVVGSTAGWGPEMLATLPATLRRLDPDILHIQHAAGSYGFRRAVFWLVPLLRARGFRRPVVVTIHEYGWWEWRPRLGGWAWRRLGPWGERKGLWDREDFALLTSANAVIATHEAAAEILAARLPQLAPRVHRIPIGPNIPALPIERGAARLSLRELYGWEADAPVIAYFGFLHPVKGLELLLIAFRHVLAEEPRARLLLIGGAQSLALQGEDARRYQDQLERLIRGWGLDPTVRLTGYLPEEAVSQHLAGADLGVLPFKGGVTAKSGSLLALWAHGLPVVATRPPLVERGLEAAASLVAPHDPGALAQALLRLLRDPLLQGELASRGRRSLEGFSWPAIARQHLAVYGQLYDSSQRSASRRQPRPPAGGPPHGL